MNTKKKLNVKITNIKIQSLVDCGGSRTCLYIWTIFFAKQLFFPSLRIMLANNVKKLIKPVSCLTKIITFFFFPCAVSPSSNECHRAKTSRNERSARTKLGIMPRLPWLHSLVDWVVWCWEDFNCI